MRKAKRSRFELGRSGIWSLDLLWVRCHSHIQLEISRRRRAIRRTSGRHRGTMRMEKIQEAEKVKRDCLWAERGALGWATPTLKAPGMARLPSYGASEPEAAPSALPGCSPCSSSSSSSTTKAAGNLRSSSAPAAPSTCSCGPRPRAETASSASGCGCSTDCVSIPPREPCLSRRSTRRWRMETTRTTRTTT